MHNFELFVILSLLVVWSILVFERKYYRNRPGRSAERSQLFFDMMYVFLEKPKGTPLEMSDRAFYAYSVWFEERFGKD